MADYPLRVLDDSTFEDVDERLVDRARSGTPRARVLQQTLKRAFDLPVRGLTLAQRNTFRTFYAANRQLVITLKWPTGQYSTENVACIFGNTSGLKWQRVDGYWSTNVVLLEV